MSLGGIVITPKGEIWLTDTANHRIVRLNVAERKLEWVAGVRAGRIDGAVAEARFRAPGMLALAPDGGVYVDEGGARLRRVSPDGTVSTSAPYTPVEPDRLGQRSRSAGVAIDAAGRLFVYDAKAREVVRLASGGPAEIVSEIPEAPSHWHPEDWDDDGYFADEVDLESIRAIRGSALAAAPDGRLFLADERTHRIWCLDDGGCHVLAGRPGYGLADRQGELARFNRPVAIAVRPDGCLLVSDAGNHCLRTVRMDGVVCTFTGGGHGEADGPPAAARFLAPGPLAVAPDGTVWLVDGRCRVCRIDSSGHVETIFRVPTLIDRSHEGHDMPFDGPLRLAVAPDDTLYVLEPRHNRIRQVSRDGRLTMRLWWAPNLAIDALDGLALDDLAVDEAGRLHAIDGWSGAILRLEPSGEALTVARCPEARGGRMPHVDRPSELWHLNVPHGYWMRTQADGTCLVADSRLHRLIRVNSGAAVVVGRPDQNDHVPFTRFRSFACNRDGVALLGEWASLRRVNPDGVVTTLMGAEAGYLRPDGNRQRNLVTAGLAWHPDGTWVFADLKGDALVMVPGDTPGTTVRPKADLSRPPLASLVALVGQTLTHIHERGNLIETPAGWMRFTFDDVSCPCCYGFKIWPRDNPAEAPYLAERDWPASTVVALRMSHDRRDPRPRLHALDCANGYSIQLPGRPSQLGATETATIRPTGGTDWGALVGRQIEALVPLPDGGLLLRCFEGAIELTPQPNATRIGWSRRPYQADDWTSSCSPPIGCVIERVLLKHDWLGEGISTQVVLELDDGSDIRTEDEARA